MFALLQLGSSKNVKENDLKCRLIDIISHISRKWTISV